MWPFDQNNQWMYQQYAQAHSTGNYGGFDHNQVLQHLLGFVQGAPYDMQQRVYEQHFSQMPYEQRALIAQQMPFQYNVDPNDPRAMSQGFLRMGQEQPHLLRQIFSHPLLMGAAVGLVGLAAKHILDHHQVPYEGQQYGNQQYGYNQGGFPNQGYNQGSFQNQGYNQGGFPNQGYNQGGFQNQGYNQGNFPNQGYNQGGFPNQGYNQGSFPNQGYGQGGGQQNPYQQQLAEEQAEINELREELNREESDRPRHHHHHNQNQGW